MSLPACAPYLKQHVYKVLWAIGREAAFSGLSRNDSRVCRLCPVLQRFSTRRSCRRSGLALPPDREGVGSVAEPAAEIDPKRAFLSRRLDPNADARIHLKRITRGR